MWFKKVNVIIAIHVIEGWKLTSPVPLTRLSLVTFSYVDLKGKIHNDGRVVVLDAVATQIENIFTELFTMQFPIAKAKPIEDYNGDDDSSMEDNNTSAYNSRVIANNPSNVSLHAYGLAIDINPVQNPFSYFATDQDKESGIRSTKPAISAVKYINRRRAKNDKLSGLAEDVVEVFARHGFTIWGGDWNFPIDWQHFQTSRAMAELLAVMSPDDGEQFFALHVQCPTLMTKLPNSNDLLIRKYKENPRKFMAIMKSHQDILDVSDDKIAISKFKTAWNNYVQ